jgi:hypothetical protein
MMYRQKGLSGPAQMGMHSEPVVTICQPSNFLPSVAHEDNTGMISACLYKFTDCRVEKVTRKSDVRSEALAAEISFIDCTEVIKEYVFASQAIHISVAEAKEKKLTEGLD